MAITTPPLAATAAVDVPPTAFWRLKGFPLIPVMILLFIAFVAVFADVLAPHDPQIGSLTARFKPPFWVKGGSTLYLLGTDQLGRDVLSRLIFGARVSMVVGITAVLVAGGIGTLAAYALVTGPMNSDWVFLPGPLLATAAIAVLLTLLLGFAGTWHALGAKPAPYLRNE